MRKYTSMTIVLCTFLFSALAPVSAKALGPAFSHYHTSGTLMARATPDGLNFPYFHPGYEEEIYSEFVPYPPQKPRKSPAVSRLGSPNIAALNMEYSIIGGASFAAVAPARHRVIHTDHDRRSKAHSGMGHKASNAVAGKFAKRLLFGAVPVLGAIILLHDLSKLTR